MTKTIKTKNGKKVDVNVGDVIFVSLLPNNFDTLVRGRYLDSKDGVITFSIINPKLEIENVFILENRVVKVEKPN